MPPDQHPTAVYLSRLAPGSRRSVRYVLDVVAAFLTANRCDAESMDWSQVRSHHTKAVSEMLASKYAPATVNKTMSALRSVLKEAWRLGVVEADHYRDAVDVRNIPTPTHLRSRALSTGELRALFCVCAGDKTPSGPRDTAMLAVLYGSGLRRGEVVALQLSDYSAGVLEIRVRGRQSDRTCFLKSICAVLLDQWIAIRGSQPGPLFCAINRGKNIQFRTMTSQSVRDIVSRRALQCGLAPFPLHSLRRTCIGNLLNGGADLIATQKMVGHVHCQTTARYDSRDSVPIDIESLLDERYSELSRPGRRRKPSH